MTEFGSLLKIVGTLGFVQLQFGQIKGFTGAAQVGNGLFFLFISGPEFLSGFFQIGGLFFQFGTAFDGGGIFFVAQTGDLDFQLHDAAFIFIQFAGAAVYFCAQSGGGFIHKVDGFIGEKAVGDVLVRQHRSRHKSAVTEFDSVVDLVTFFQSPQNGNGVLHRGGIDHNGLKTAFQSGIFFDIFSVLIQRRGADAVEFSPCQHGFEKISGIHGAFRSPGSHNGMEFIDKEDDPALSADYFIENGLETFLKFPPELGSGDQSAHIQRDQLAVFQIFRNIAPDDTPCETFCDGGFTHTGFADEYGIVFGTA